MDTRLPPHIPVNVQCHWSLTHAPSRLPPAVNNVGVMLSYPLSPPSRLPPAVNNVGVMLSYPMRHGDVPEADIWRHILVNTAPAAVLCQMLLPGMVARGRGAVVNISSSSAIGPMPFLNIYSATKVGTVHGGTKHRAALRQMLHGGRSWVPLTFLPKLSRYVGIYVPSRYVFSACTCRKSPRFPTWDFHRLTPDS